jgi:hypothetical protein
MERGISLVTDNEILVDKVRCQVEQDFNKEIDPSPESPHKIYRQLVADSIETPVYTFTLPDITRYPGRKFQEIQIHIFFSNMKITYSIVKDSNADLGVIFRFLQNSPITKAVCTKISKKLFCIFGKILIFLRENKEA